MNRKMFRMCALGVAVAGLTAWTSPDIQASVSYRAVAVTGDAAPGTDPGVVYSDFSVFSPTLNSAGQMAFRSILTGPGVDNTNSSGIWSEGSGSLSLVAREGGAAPGTEPGVVYSGLIDNPVLNSAGQTAFTSELTGSGVYSTNNTGIWSQTSGTLNLILRKGDAAPDTEPGVVYSGLSDPKFNDAGQLAFSGSLTGPGVGITNDRGIWSGASGSLSLVTREGDAAPGTDPGVVFFGYSADLLFNQAGQTAFKIGLAGPGVDSSNNFGIWSEGSGSLSLVAREGHAAPGTDPGVVYSDLQSNHPVLNSAGQMAFRGVLTGSGVDGTNDMGIWSGGGGSLSLVAREGGAAPGTDPGVVYGNFMNIMNNPVLNGAGQIAFWGAITGPGVGMANDAGIWSGGAGSLSLVMREGDAAPGTDPGVVFADLLFTQFNTALLNGAGQIAFESGLTGPGVDNSNNSGIWVTDPNGVLTLIARRGNLYDINDDPLIDELRTISSVSLCSGGGDGVDSSTRFNDAGQLVFWLGFTDGSEGFFVASIQAALTGDLNGDGFVGITDLNIVLAAWNQNVPPGNPLADPSGDGFIGIEDLNVVLGNWNAGTPPGDYAPGDAIPEPVAALIITACAPLILRRRR
jgi:hypothetical protein